MPHTLQFREFELRMSSYELRRDGERIKLERIPMELLVLLIENKDKLVSRETIIQRLWGSDVFLETEHSINTAVNKLRAALKDNPKDPVFIETVIGKGYRFIAEVKGVEDSSEEGHREPLPLASSNGSAPWAHAAPVAISQRLPLDRAPRNGRNGMLVWAIAAGVASILLPLLAQRVREWRAQEE